MAEDRSHVRQMIASLVVAVIIVAVTITFVTAKLGVNGGVDSERERRQEVLELREERQEESQDRREERLDDNG
jgi:hypothetical protein